jgi:hypothetical protein
VRSSRFSYNQYIARSSILDQVNEKDSPISRSPFKGLLRLCMITAFMYCLNNFLVRFSIPEPI